VGVEKQLQHFTNSNVATSHVQINESVKSIDSIIPEEYRSNPQEYLIRIMQAVALGSLSLSPSQHNALRLLFDKKVAPAPKEINVNSNIRVENVIHTFLQENKDNMQSALSVAKESAAIEAEYSYLED
jgi:hypothetical protein